MLQLVNMKDKLLCKRKTLHLHPPQTTVPKTTEVPYPKYKYPYSIVQIATNYTIDYAPMAPICLTVFNG